MFYYLYRDKGIRRIQGQTANEATCGMERLYISNVEWTAEDKKIFLSKCVGFGLTNPEIIREFTDSKEAFEEYPYGKAVILEPEIFKKWGISGERDGSHK